MGIVTIVSSCLMPSLVNYKLNSVEVYSPHCLCGVFWFFFHSTFPPEISTLRTAEILDLCAWEYRPIHVGYGRRQMWQSIHPHKVIGSWSSHTYPCVLAQVDDLPFLQWTVGRWVFPFPQVSQNLDSCFCSRSNPLTFASVCESSSDRIGDATWFHSNCCDQRLNRLGGWDLRDQGSTGCVQRLLAWNLYFTHFGEGWSPCLS